MYDTELLELRNLYKKGIFEPEFYKNKITCIEQLDDYDAFQSIPFTYKNEIRNTSVEERSTTRPEDIYGIFSSSGTTGEKTYYIYNRNDKRVHEDFVRTFFTELGVTEKDIGGVMAPVDTGVMAHTMMWQFTTMGAGYVNCPIPSPENIIDTITKVPVTVIATRPSIASGIAYNPVIQQMAQKSHVKKLFMGGGFLSKERRKLLERSWHAECFNMFGMSEMFGPMAGECRKKNGLHYLNNYLMIEVVDPHSGKPVDEGEPGVAVYTTLWDKGFPLLRYWTDDIMILTTQRCDCGSKYPRLFYLGRLADCYIVNDAYIFPENLENILFKYGFIGEYCVEKSRNHYLVKTEGNEDSYSNEMEAEIRTLFGADVIVEIVPPKSLNYDGHGRRFTVNEQFGKNSFGRFR